ncbi:unnamed protein product [Closterium sp. NIES-65]|nr:unnamed protein product [Closterium sp. NIES-65]
MTGSPPASVPTWIVEVTRHRDLSQEALELALEHMAGRAVTLLLVHVMSEVPTSRNMTLPASEVDPKTALQHAKKLVDILMKPLLATATASRVACGTAVELNDRREIGLCLAARRANAERVYIGVKRCGMADLQGVAGLAGFSGLIWFDQLCSVGSPAGAGPTTTCSASPLPPPLLLPPHILSLFRHSPLPLSPFRPLPPRSRKLLGWSSSGVVAACQTSLPRACTLVVSQGGRGHKHQQLIGAQRTDLSALPSVFLQFHSAPSSNDALAARLAPPALPPPPPLRLNPLRSPPPCTCAAPPTPRRWRRPPPAPAPPAAAAGGEAAERDPWGQMMDRGKGAEQRRAGGGGERGKQSRLSFSTLEELQQMAVRESEASGAQPMSSAARHRSPGAAAAGMPARDGGWGEAALRGAGRGAGMGPSLSASCSPSATPGGMAMGAGGEEGQWGAGHAVRKRSAERVVLPEGIPEEGEGGGAAGRGDWDGGGEEEGEWEGGGGGGGGRSLLADELAMLEAEDEGGEGGRGGGGEGEGSGVGGQGREQQPRGGRQCCGRQQRRGGRRQRVSHPLRPSPLVHGAMCTPMALHQPGPALSPAPCSPLAGSSSFRGSALSPGGSSAGGSRQGSRQGSMQGSIEGVAGGGVGAMSGGGSGPTASQPAASSFGRSAFSSGQLTPGSSSAVGDGFDCRQFTAQQLARATKNYAQENLLGKGSFGAVFRGEMLGCQVAVKRLEGQGWQGPDEFRVEVEVLSRMRHPHIVLLMGCCTEEMALVYEFLPGGTLQDKLGPPKTADAVRLSWSDRLRICGEMATALMYLHRNDPPIVHRDLKPDNILLDGNLASKIGDVGLARLLEADGSTTMKVRGTLGYIDPEEVETCEISVLSDVYALGLIMLQLLTGQRAVKAVHRMLAECAKHAKTAQGSQPGPGGAAVGAVGVVSKYLESTGGEWRMDLAEEAAGLALRCADRRRENRPSLKKEVQPALVRIAAAAEEEVKARKKHSDLQFICPLSKVCRVSCALRKPTLCCTLTHALVSLSHAVVTFIITLSLLRVVHANATTVCTLSMRTLPCSALHTPRPRPRWQEVMRDPVVAGDGFTYEREHITRWMASCTTLALHGAAPAAHLPHPQQRPQNAHLLPQHALISSPLGCTLASHSLYIHCNALSIFAAGGRCLFQGPGLAVLHSAPLCSLKTHL